jgi:hypothetical protein
MAPLAFRDAALLHACGIVNLMCEVRPSSSFSPTNGKKPHEIMRRPEHHAKKATQTTAQWKYQKKPLRQ